jgi:hypothetical protein
MVTVCFPPLEAIVAGEKVAVAPAGNPDAVKVTLAGYVVDVGLIWKL